MTLNPACTPGEAFRAPDGSGIVATCGCGWNEGGFPSRRQALMAQKAHRFPGPNPKVTADEGPRTSRRAATALPTPRTRPSTTSRKTGT